MTQNMLARHFSQKSRVDSTPLKQLVHIDAIKNTCERNERLINEKIEVRVQKYKANLPLHTPPKP